MSIHSLSLFYICIYPGEGNGNSLQYSCLENPMDRGAGGLQSMVLQRVGQDWVTNTFTSLSFTLVDWPKKTLVQFMSKNVLPMFPSRSFTVSCLTLKSVSHFEFILVYGVRVCSNFWFTGGCPAFPMPLAEETFIYCIILPSLLKIN